MRFLITVLAMAISTAAFAATKTVKLEDEAQGFARALTNKAVYSNFKKAMAAGNTISEMTAEINTDARDASLVTYSMTTRQCSFVKGGQKCLGGASLTIESNCYTTPGSGGLSCTYSSTLYFIK